MKTNLPSTLTAEPVHILLLGNNPIEMGRILEKLHQVKHHKVITEIAFDIQSLIGRLMQFKPHFIFIDDNIGKRELIETIQRLTTDKKTKDIPITLLKNSNYIEAWGNIGILDFLLKQNLTSDHLYNTIRNAFKFKRTQQYLYSQYRRKKASFLKLLDQ